MSKDKDSAASSVGVYSICMQKAEIQRRLDELLQTLPNHDHVRRISLFGSHLHGTAKEDSDIDLLIEFTQPVSIFAVARMEREMSAALGRKVDLSTPKSLSRYFRDDVVREAEPLFESVA